MNEEIKAVEEIAKTTGKAIDASAKFGAFLVPFIKKPLQEAIGIVEDKLKYARWENQMKLMTKATKYLHEINLDEPTRIIPLKLAVPLLQAASIEDDDYLQDLWAKLLTNFASANSGISLQRVYIDILEHINPLEARILEKIYALPDEQRAHKTLYTKNLPECIEIYAKPGILESGNPNQEVELALSNLARQGCISPSMVLSGELVFSSIYPTLMGKAFIDACTIKNINAETT